jgi:hypothetical protein
MWFVLAEKWRQGRSKIEEREGIMFEGGIEED